MKTHNASSLTQSAILCQDARTLRQTFVLKNKNGLHARPCALLVKNLRPFRCLVEVDLNGELANGQSIISLMALAAGYESKLAFTFTGEDAAQALAVVRHLFDTRFEEAYG